MARSKITIGKDPGPKGRKPEPSVQDNKTAIRGRMFIALLQIQQSYPTLRLGQIIGNACSRDIYYESDEDLIKALEAYAKGSHSPPAERNESHG